VANLGYVGSVGPPTAEVSVWAEAPATYEVMEGEPLVGPSGQLMNKVMQRVGILREACYIDNVIRMV
jgi:DNA polymerase